MGADKELKHSGFFNLFDWKAKSRRKPFANQSNHSEDVNSTVSKFWNNEDDTATQMTADDFSYCSSLVDEDVYISKSPGVVGRLMGLNSLPNSSSTPFFETPQKKNQMNISQDQMIVKRTGRPIEKFQSELLPPKSAKSIPTTHHKRLSPIKSSGFTNSTDYIIEAAAKIIESDPQSLPKVKVPKVSSSAPLKVANLREKLDASQAVTLRNSSKVGESSVKRNGDDGERVKIAEKSISLAIQAKVNVQKRRLMNQRERQDLTLLSSEQNGKNLEKQRTNNSSRSVLKPNDLKQNSSLEKNKPSPKLSTSKTDRQTLSISKQRSSRKIEVNENESTAKRRKETVTHEKVTKKTPRKKRMTEDKTLTNTDSPSYSVFTNFIEEREREGNDAISFSVTIPLSLVGSTSEPSKGRKRVEMKGSDVSPILLPVEKKGFPLTPLSQTSDETVTLRTSSITNVTFKNNEEINCATLKPKIPNEPMTTSGAFENSEELDCATSKPKTYNKTAARRSFMSLQNSSSTTSSITNGSFENGDGATSKAKKEKNRSWELEYISKILWNFERMFEAYAMGRSSKVISPHLYEQIETRKYWRDSEGRTERKSLFDFVVERVEIKCAFGGYKAWKHAAKNSQTLVGEVYRELMTWKSMWHSMVDDVVDKDMSFLEGRWLDFQVDDLSFYSHIECHILHGLLDELLFDATFKVF